MQYHSDERVPDLSGSICSDFLVEEIWQGERRTHPMNAFHVQVNEERWYRIRVNCSGVAWKAIDSPHRPVEKGREFRVIPVVDPDVVGRRIAKIDYGEWEPVNFLENGEETEEGWQSYDEAATRIHFTDGSVLEVRYAWLDVSISLYRLNAAHTRHRSKSHR